MDILNELLGYAATFVVVVILAVTFAAVSIAALLK
jgi:hypothetical protein